MTMSELARNILAQPESLACVLQQQSGEGAVPLQEAALLLRSGKRVLITGIGASLYAALPLEYALRSQGIDAVAVEAGELLHYPMQASRDAVAVVISRSGQSVEIAKLVAALRGRQPIIGISNVPESLLAQSADVSIHIGSLADEIVAIQSYTGTVLTLHLLAQAVTNTLDAAREEIEALRPALADLIQASMADIHGWDSFLEAALPVYLLARGPSCASAREGSLLFNEIAKLPSVGMPAASFRHGPVEIVDPQFRGLIFAPQGHTRDLNLALGGDLARFGGRIRMIGPSGQVFPGLEWVEISAVPENLAPLFEIIPVQVAALRMAELRGIAPGSFRYAPQVTMDESAFGRRSNS